MSAALPSSESRTSCSSSEAEPRPAPGPDRDHRRDRRRARPSSRRRSICSSAASRGPGISPGRAPSEAYVRGRVRAAGPGSRWTAPGSRTCAERAFGHGHARGGACSPRASQLQGRHSARIVQGRSAAGRRDLRGCARAGWSSSSASPSVGSLDRVRGRRSSLLDGFCGAGARFEDPAPSGCASAHARATGARAGAAPRGPERAAPPRPRPRPAAPRARPRSTRWRPTPGRGGPGLRPQERDRLRRPRRACAPPPARRETEAARAGRPATAARRPSLLAERGAPGRRPCRRRRGPRCGAGRAPGRGAPPRGRGPGRGAAPLLASASTSEPGRLRAGRGRASDALRPAEAKERRHRRVLGTETAPRRRRSASRTPARRQAADATARDRVERDTLAKRVRPTTPKAAPSSPSAQRAEPARHGGHILDPHRGPRREPRRAPTRSTDSITATPAWPPPRREQRPAENFESDAHLS